MIAWGSERLRAGPWRGDRTIAYLNPVPGVPLPSPEFLRRCLRTLAGQGYRRVVTGALAAPEQAPFRLVGFAPSEELHLLSHDLADLPVPAVTAGTTLRRALRRDRPAVLELDALAFEPFWQLDEAGLDEALTATPHARFRLAVSAGDPDDIVGYAVTGRAGRRGYLQRLAVRPDRQGSGLGTLLVADALRWLRRWRGERAMVNTQLTNERALRLYEHLGFRREPSGLSVLTIDLP